MLLANGVGCFLGPAAWPHPASSCYFHQSRLPAALTPFAGTIALPQQSQLGHAAVRRFTSGLAQHVSHMSPVRQRLAVGQLRPTARQARKTHLPSETHRHTQILQRQARMHKILLIIICFLLPPLGVYIHRPTCNRDFWINVLLTLLMWLPGEYFILRGPALRAFHVDDCGMCR